MKDIKVSPHMPVYSKPKFGKRHLILIGLLVLVFTSMLYLLTYGQPDFDIQFYILDAYQIAHGRLPYRDFFDHKPPLFWGTLALGRWLGNRYLSYFFVFVAFMGIAHTIVLYWTYHTLRRIWGFARPLALTGAVLAWGLSVFGILGLTLNGGTGNGSILIFMSIWTMLGVWSFQQGRTTSQIAWFGLCGLCAGLAILTRLSPALPIFAVTIWGIDLSQNRLRWRELKRYALMFFSAMLAPLTLVLPILPHAYRDVVVFNQFYYATQSVMWLKRIALGFTGATLSLSLYVGILVLVWWLNPNRDKFVKKMDFICGYIAIELALTFIQPRSGIYYQYFPVVFPLSLLAASGLTIVGNSIKKQVPLAITSMTVFLLILSLTHQTRKTTPYLLWNANIHHSAFLEKMSAKLCPGDTLWTVQFYPSAYLQLGVLPASRVHFYEYDLNQAPLSNPPTYVLTQDGTQPPEIADWLTRHYSKQATFQPNLVTESTLIPRWFQADLVSKTNIYQPQTWVLYYRKDQN